RRGSALALVNPAYTSQIDSRTGLLQGRRRWDRFYCLDGVVLDADANAACNILARLYDEEITLYMPYREVKALLAEQTRLSVGTAPPGLELRGLATVPPSTESEVPATVPNSAV
ncbi:MAG: zinc ribbon domain-containing protein, partial [Caldilineaceae bacterium]|nr:zinc ribbon domain-containing protein [Caldilineaceae bacterium]